MKLFSPRFEHNHPIPPDYTCDGADVSPPLRIEDIPEQAKSLVLIVDDPDAPTAEPWVHWLVWNIDPGTAEIEENQVPPGAGEGINDFKKIGYGGPCPPSGTHRYFFKLYALDARPGIQPRANREKLEEAIQGHVIARAELVGLYRRG